MSIEDDPNKNPLENAKLPDKFSADDIARSKTDADIIRAGSGVPALQLAREALGDVEVTAISGAANDKAVVIMYEIGSDDQYDELPDEAKHALRFLGDAVNEAAAENGPGVFSTISDELSRKEGEAYDEAVDAAPDGLEERYLRVLEHLAYTVDYLSLMEMLQEQKKVVSPTLAQSLAGSIADMQCDELAEIINRHFAPKEES